jgi:hypothetical protein
MPRVVDEDVCLDGCRYCDGTEFGTTYSLEVPMNDIAGVEVVEALGDVGQLVTGGECLTTMTIGAPASPSRSTSECFLRYSGRFPPDIQLEMARRGVGVTPVRGKRFRCPKRFHVMACWQKSCESLQRRETGKQRHR